MREGRERMGERERERERERVRIFAIDANLDYNESK